MIPPVQASLVVFVAVGKVSHFPPLSPDVKAQVYLEVVKYPPPSADETGKNNPLTFLETVLPFGLVMLIL